MTTAAKEFWTSTSAQLFPFSLEIHGERWAVIEQADYYTKTYKKLVSRGWIPNQGEILEFGAGASSGLLFPPDTVRDRIIATDISEGLLSRNAVPWGRKYIADAGSDVFPEHWNGRFGLVLAMHLSRYLDTTEKIHMATQARRMLQDHGRILLLDSRKTPDPDVASAVGEASPFIREQECAILQETGFTNIESELYSLEFFNMHGEKTMSQINYVTAFAGSR